jgi:hypothetical protein
MFTRRSIHACGVMVYMCSIFILRIDGERYQRSCRFMNGYPMPYTCFGKCIDERWRSIACRLGASMLTSLLQSTALRVTQSTEGMVARHPRSSPFLRILDTVIPQSNTLIVGKLRIERSVIQRATRAQYLSLCVTCRPEALTQQRLFRAERTHAA